MKRTILVLFTLSFLFSCTTKNNNVCIIKGEIIGCNYKTLILFKSHQDPIYLSEKIIIDKNNSFKYTIVNPTEERYSLMSEEDFAKNNFTAYPIDFFADNKSIEFKIHPIDQMIKNEIIGSELSLKLLQFQRKEKMWLDSLQHKNLSNRDSISKVFFFNKLKYIKENQNVIGYSILVQLIPAVDYIPFLDKNDLLQIAASFQKKFPKHPYTEFIEASKLIKVGNHFTNFNAPDKSGRLIEISDIIKVNKLTLIDLWAPWCEPCISKGREIVSLYKKYKDVGFEVIGVVGGIKDIESYKNALDKENYPWQNLSEINNQNKIWEKYNIMNYGGRMFLIDNKGIILAIDPTVGEIEKFLKEKL
jgi:thiol-disulfide isomerase/thioredoxin